MSAVANVVGSPTSRLRLLAPLTALAVVFAVALTFATLELPHVINEVLAEYFPDYIPAQPEAQDLVRAWRPIGYACLAAVGILILAGFVARKSSLSSVGVVLFFLPTFGYFASYMFFLAGLGILRAAWIPFWEPLMIKMGDIAYLPYMAVVYPFSLVGVDVRNALAYLAIGIGFFIFVLGMVAWFYGRVSKRETVTFWIYRYSRHPQYLGFIIWSFGVMLLASFRPVPWGGENPGASLPWLISTLFVICMALWEEVRMSRRDKAGYLKYKESAPFMFPVPKPVVSVATAPVRFLLKKRPPESGKEIAGTFVVLLLIFLALSSPFVLLNWPSGGQGWSLWPFGHPPGMRPKGPPGGGEEPDGDQDPGGEEPHGPAPSGNDETPSQEESHGPAPSSDETSRSEESYKPVDLHVRSAGVESTEGHPSAHPSRSLIRSS